MRVSKFEDNKIFVEIPLTAQSGKARVKIRNSFYEYGLPTATRQISFSQKHYIEWQIGYDADKSDSEKINLTSLKNTEFIGANGKKKALYELSEYLFYFTKCRIIEINEINDILKFLENIDSNNFLDSKFQILRSHPMQRDILIEIIIKEKQRAIGVQPMLYVCFPITELKPAGNKPSLLGRVADSKECAYLILDSKDKQFLLESFKIFGILSESHNYDIRRILELIKNYIQ